MKNFMLLIAYALVGFLLGIMIVSDLNNRNFNFNIEAIYYWVNISFIAISVILLALSLLNFFKLRKMVNTDVHDDELDAFEVRKYNQYSKTLNLINNLFVVSLMSVVISATNMYFPDGFISLLVFFAASILSPTVVNYLNKVYPDRSLPKAGEKNYVDKLYEASDEGERHVMARALYKSYNQLTGFLIIGFAFIIAYSFFTDDSQIFSVIIIGLAIILSQITYYKNIKEK